MQKASETLPESLSGLIERVTFFNEDNGFGVLKAKAEGHRDLITVVGSLPSVSAGEWHHSGFGSFPSTVSDCDYHWQV